MHRLLPRLFAFFIFIFFYCSQNLAQISNGINGNGSSPMTKEEGRSVSNALESKIDASSNNTSNAINSILSNLKHKSDSIKTSDSLAKTATKNSKIALEKANDASSNSLSNTLNTNRFWVLLAAVLVFFMQAGFKCLEVGMARTSHDANTAIMNLMNWLVLCIFFYYFGYKLMFGYSFHESGLIGQFQSNSEVYKGYNGLGVEHFLFQLAFAATTATIVDGAILERTSMFSYFFIALIIGLVIYPVFGHWAWNEYKIENGLSSKGWLKNLGFQDFAGSTVVHSIGAWSALSAIYWVGPRRYRFNDKAPETQKNKFKPYSLGYSVLGVIMLWFGWWGFNGGSKLRYDDTISSIILNTNLAGAAAGIIAFFDSYFRDRKNVNVKVIGGVLGGLVAITASCDVVGPVGATFIGILAGFIHNLAYDFLVKKKIDDVAGAIPVHGACGVLGTFLAGIIPFLFDGGKDILNGNSLGTQIGVQLLGIATAFVFTSLVAWCSFALLEKLIGLRTSINEEDAGEEIDNNLLHSYDGTLKVSIRRHLGKYKFAWSRFMPWETSQKDRDTNAAWIDFINTAKDFEKQDKSELEKKFNLLQENHYQIIRDDDIPATLENVTKKLNIFIPKQIFICYRSDERAFAHALKKDIVIEDTNKKYKLFIDTEGIIAAQKNKEVIGHNIQSCSLFILIIGPRWIERLKEKLQIQEYDWAMSELIQAIENKITVVPLLLNIEFSELKTKLSKVRQEFSESNDLLSIYNEITESTTLDADETLQKSFLDKLMRAISFHTSKNVK